MCNAVTFDKDEKCDACNGEHEELCYFCLKCEEFVVDYLNSECFENKHFRDLRVNGNLIRKEIVKKFPSFLQPAVEGTSKRKATVEESEEEAVNVSLPSTSKRVRCEGQPVNVDLEEDGDCIRDLVCKSTMIYL